MTFNDDMAAAIRRKLETFLTAEQAEAFMEELNRPSVDEQFAALKAWLVSRFDQIDARFDENDRRWDDNDRRWEEAARRFEQIDQRFDRSEIRMEKIEGTIALLAERDKIADERVAAIGSHVELIGIQVQNLSNGLDRVVTRVDGNNERIDKLAYWLVWAMVAVFTAIIAGMGVAVAIGS